MGGVSTVFDVRHIPSAGSDHLEALHRALSIKWAARARPARRVADLLTYAERQAIPIDLVFGAYAGRKLVSAAAAVESPGRAALVFAPTEGGNEESKRATLAALGTMTEAAWERSLRLLQVLIDPESADPAPILTQPGFRYLTRLLYLIRRISSVPPSNPAPHDLGWEHYSSAAETRFHETLESTYAQSLDCPELTGLRTTADVLAGHRATGIFDPSLWWLATRENTPVGVLLLNRIPRRRALEIVYMGVAQASRGTGVANALLQKAVEAARRVNATSMALAVDQRNTPARKMYARWNFTQATTRDAWIASPRQIRV